MLKKVLFSITASTVIFATNSIALTMEIPIFLDESTSMKGTEKLIKSEADKLIKEIKNSGFKVQLFKFGENIEPLKNLTSYKPADDNTDYIALIEFIQKNDSNKPVFLITDGRIPRKLLKKLDILKEEVEELKDNGNIICILSTMKKNAFLNELGFVVKPVGKAKELVDSCVQIWKKLNEKVETDKNKKAHVEVKKDKEPVKKEAKAEKKVLILPETKETSLEMIIKVK